jgi:replicative DNA helicase
MHKNFPISDLSLHKIMPQSLEAEESILSACIISPESLSEVVGILQPTHFYRSSHQKIFQAMTDLFAKGEPVDLVTLANKLKQKNELALIGGASCLAKLVDTVPVAVNAVHYANIIRDKAALRLTIQKSQTIIKSCLEDSDDDVSSIIDTAQKEILSIEIENPDDKNYEPMAEIAAKGFDVLDERSKNPGKITGVPTGFTQLDMLTWGLQPSDLIVVAARPSMGKCLGKGTKVVMYSGELKKVEKIKPGDFLMGIDSKPKKVLSTTYGKEMMYWIKQLRGINYRVNGSHVLSLKRSKNENNKKHGEIKNISVNNILNEKSRTFLNRWKGYKVGVEYTEKKVPLEPYFMGLWLGDGTSKNSSITNPDIEIINYLNRYAKRRDEIVTIVKNNKTNCHSYCITNGLRNRGGCRGEASHNTKLTDKDVIEIKKLIESGEMQKNIAKKYNVNGATISNIKCGRTWKDNNIKKAVQTELRELGVINNKHIPNIYLINSRKVRLELLAGLIDSDGYLGKDGRPYEITMKNKLLMEQIKHLCDSLGLSTGGGLKEKIATCQGGFKGLVYKITFNGDLTKCPIKLQRKRQKEPFKISYDYTITGISIEQDKVDDYYGFELEGDGLFLLEDMTVTHNSGLACNIARHVAIENNIPVAIFSLEMSKQQLLFRFLSDLAKVNGQKFKSGMFSRDEWRQLSDAGGKIADAPIYIDDEGGLHINQVLRRSRRMWKELGIGLIIVDYLQLMQGDKTETRDREIASITSSLKGLAKELNIPVIALSQLNRDLEKRSNKRPQMSDLRESGSIENDADIVSFIYRDEVYNKDENNPNKGIAEIIISKHRNGPIGTIKLSFVDRYASFYNLDSFQDAY